tara:strand:+ start:1774 stop:2124 length:351 start_codon:yes stop_codon:yes gene_type:complete
MPHKDIGDKVALLERLFSQDLKLINFFQTDLTKYRILLIVMISYYQDENYTIEKIIDNLSRDISSRAHQLNCISDAAAKGYLLKVISNSDKRKKYLKPSEELIVQFELYLKKFNKN